MRCVNCGAPNPIRVQEPWTEVFGNWWCPVGEHEADEKEVKRR